MFNLNTQDDENVFTQSPQRITLLIYSFLCELCEKPFKLYFLREMLVARPRNN